MAYIQVQLPITYCVSIYIDYVRHHKPLYLAVRSLCYIVSRFSLLRSRKVTARSRAMPYLYIGLAVGQSVLDLNILVAHLYDESP